MGTIWNANLTNAEIERYAYLYGKAHLAAFAADLEDKKDDDDRHEQEIEAARAEAYEEGKTEGMGLDADTMINALQDEVNRLKADHRRCRENLQAVSGWLATPDNHSTLAKRKAFAFRLHVALLSTPHY